MISWRLAFSPTGREQEDDTGVAEVKVAMPFTLKKQLVTDWENVTQEPRRLVKLPRELTAADVMSQYMESKAKRSTPPQTARAQELMDGVRMYFDKVKRRARRMRCVEGHSLRRDVGCGIVVSVAARRTTVGDQ